MFSVGNIVLYGMQGICEISEITEKKFKSDVIKYYVLVPVFDKSSKIFVPTENKTLTAKMRRILSKQEILDIIEAMPEDEIIWISDDGERKEKYKEILSGGDRTKIIKLIKTLYLHQKHQKQIGKKLHISDERMLKEAEKLLYDEFAFVLDIDRDSVLPFILEKIESA